MKYNKYQWCILLSYTNKNNKIRLGTFEAETEMQAIEKSKQFWHEWTPYPFPDYHEAIKGHLVFVKE